jgi:hypothetical protein
LEKWREEIVKMIKVWEEKNDPNLFICGLKQLRMLKEELGRIVAVWKNREVKAVKTRKIDLRGISTKINADYSYR